MAKLSVVTCAAISSLIIIFSLTIHAGLANWFLLLAILIQLEIISHQLEKRK